MKIMLVNYEYKPQCGGAGLATFNLARELSRLGHEVDVLAGWDYKFGEPEKIKNVNAQFIKIKKKNIHQSTALGLLTFVVKGLFKIHKMTRNKSYDIIQFYFSVPTGLLKYGITGKIPYVVSLRGMDVPGFRRDKYSVLSKMTMWVNHRIIKNSSAVTALSTEFAQVFHDFEPEIDPIIIPNGLFLEEFKEKKNYNRKIRKFVSVTRLTAFKKIDIMIKAFVELHKKYDDISLDIYGEGFQRKELEELIANNNAGSYIFLKGYERAEVLKDALRDYDAFELLTVSDSFGQVFTEAMACGLPIICAEAGGPKDIIVSNVTGVFVRPEDLRDTISKMEWCIEHPNEMKEYGIAGRKRVADRFTLNSVARQHVALYEEILAKND